MTTRPQHETLNIEEQLARIAQMRVDSEKSQAQTTKLVQDIRLAAPQTFFQGGLAMAALIGAGAALAKLFFPG